jgi:hypothetical protein
MVLVNGHALIQAQLLTIPPCMMSFMLMFVKENALWNDLEEFFVYLVSGFYMQSSLTNSVRIDLPA